MNILIDAAKIDSLAASSHDATVRLSAFAIELLIEMLSQVNRSTFVHPETYADLHFDRIDAEIDKALAALMDDMLVGTVVWLAFTPPPPGMLICDGREYDAAEYPRLASRLGTAYARPNGRFAVPDLLNRFVLSALQPGQLGGEATVTLTIDQMPAHTHSVSGSLSTITTPGELPAVQTVLQPLPLPEFTSAVGGGMAHNNMPPYVTLIPCIIA